MIQPQFVILIPHWREKNLSCFRKTTETLRCAQGDSF